MILTLLSVNIQFNIYVSYNKILKKKHFTVFFAYFFFISHRHSMSTNVRENKPAVHNISNTAQWIQPIECQYTLCNISNNTSHGAQWLSGRVLDSRPRGRGFEPHWLYCVVSLSKNIDPSLVLVQPRKTRPFITEILLMERKESNQANKQDNTSQMVQAHRMTHTLCTIHVFTAQNDKHSHYKNNNTTYMV